MKILITGGTGLIGTKLVTALADRGHEIVVLSRSPEKQQAFPSTVQVAGWDARTPQGWSEHLNGSDVVINLAGENLAGEGFFPTRWNAERRTRIIESRVQAGAALSAAIAQAEQRPALLIQASAIGYYGPRDDQAVNENSQPGNDFLAQTCVQWEAATQTVESQGVRRAIARIGVVLTPEGGALKRLLLPFKLFAGGPFGSGQQWYSWIHIDDLIQALVFLTEHPTANGVFNLVSPNPLTNRDFSKALGRAMGRPSWLPVPGFAMRLAFGEVATVVLDGQRVLPQHLEQLGFRFNFAQAEPAFRDLLN